MRKRNLSLLLALLSVAACGKICCPGKGDSKSGCNTPGSQLQQCKTNSTMTMPNDNDKKMLNACHLTSKEQRQRMEVLGKTLFKDADKVNELETGIELVYTQPVAYSEKLLEFINFERQCCPSLSFELSFTPEQGPVYLRILGDKDTKEQILSGLREYGHF